MYIYTSCLLTNNHVHVRVYKFSGQFERVELVLITEWPWPSLISGSSCSRRQRTKIGA